jgi:hypothetical protein
MTTTRNTSAGALALIVLTALCTAAFAAGTAAGNGSTTTGCTGSYSWPVKPFDRPHPVRGSFGDPRMQFDGPPTLETLLSGSGSFSFHQGVDVSTPNGTPVYAVADGTVVRVTSDWIRVDCGNGRAFEYWHLAAAVRAGQRVRAGETVIGKVKRPSLHVHLTQLQDGRAVNPLAPGRLAPYEDTTRPRILGIAIRRTETGPDELPQLVRGSVVLIAEAVDTPAVRVPGIWSDLPVTPARVSWRIERWTGRVVVPARAARDVRESVPSGTEFWSTFARGTVQNMAVFGDHYSYLQGGRYLFRLTRGSFDTRDLRDGVYDLVVTAEDVAGNKDVQRLRFTVHNEAGWR